MSSLIQTRGMTYQEVSQLTMVQIHDLLKEPEELEKQLRWQRMTPTVRELARKVGYIGG